jgi:hypothetical protein
MLGARLELAGELGLPSFEPPGEVLDKQPLKIDIASSNSKILGRVVSPVRISLIKKGRGARTANFYVQLLAAPLSTN